MPEKGGVQIIRVYKLVEIIRYVLMYHCMTRKVCTVRLDTYEKYQGGQHTYHTLGRTMTGHSILKLRIFAVPITWGNYNHGVIHDEVINTAVV